MLAKIPKNLLLKEEKYKIAFNSVWHHVSKMLAEPLFKHYTDHTIEHSKRIILLASGLIKNGSLNLCQEERFILLCAIVLHDIGMQTNEYIEDKPHKPTEEQLETIRQNHHEYSYELIKKNYKEYGLQGQADLVEYIAQVAKNHRKTNLEIESENKDYEGNPLRLKLLSVIIRLSDCLDYDHRRVNLEILSIFKIEPKSEALWFCHYYVQSLKIVEKKIELVFRFPKVYEKENVKTSITQYVTSEIKDQIDKLLDLLTGYNIHFFKDAVVYNIEYDDLLMELPEDAYKYVVSHLNSAKETKEISSILKTSTQIEPDRFIDHTKSNKNCIIFKRTKEFLNGFKSEKIKFSILRAIPIVNTLKRIKRSGKLIRLKDFSNNPKIEIRSIYDHILSIAHLADCLLHTINTNITEYEYKELARIIAFHDLNEIILGDIPEYTNATSLTEQILKATLKPEREDIANKLIRMFLSEKQKESFDVVLMHLSKPESNLTIFLEVLDIIDPIIAVWRYLNHYRGRIKNIDEFIERLSAFFEYPKVKRCMIDAKFNELSNFVTVLQNQDYAKQYYENSDFISSQSFGIPFKVVENIIEGCPLFSDGESMS